MTPSTPRRRPGPALGTPRAKRLPRAQREEQILAIAEEVFARKGYAETTMEEIAAEAGITKPVIYDYFSSKEGLLGAAISRARTQLRKETVEVWQAMPPGSTFKELFYVGIRAYFDFIEAHQESFSLIQQESVVVRGYAEAGIEDIRAEQSAIIVESFALLPELAGVTRIRLEGYAEVVVGACERVAVWRVRHPEVSSQDATDIVFNVVWPGLRLLAPGIKDD